MESTVPLAASFVRVSISRSSMELNKALGGSCHLNLGMHPLLEQLVKETSHVASNHRFACCIRYHRHRLHCDDFN